MLFLANAGRIGPPKGMAPQHRGVVRGEFPAPSLISPTLAEQTRKVLAALTPNEVAELRKRFGIS